MRGISAIIAVVLILLITVSLAAGAYLFLSMTMSQTTTAAQQGISQTMTQMTKSFTIEAVDGPRISIRNTGQAQLSNFSVYVDNILVNVSQVSIAPDEVKTILIYDFIDFSQSREIKVVSGTLAQTKIVSKQDSTLVGYWKFDEGSGTTAADSSGNGNTGAINGSVTWTPGKFGNALNFDGVSNYVDCGNASSLNLNPPLTYEAWIYPKSFDSAGVLYFMTKGVADNNCGIGFGIMGTSDASNKGKLFLYNGSAVVYSTTPLSINNWYHVVTTNDGTTTRLYINGVLNNSSPQIIKNCVSYNFWIGDRSTYPAFHFNGTIDEARVYSRALSADEIWNHYVHGPV